MTMQGHLVPVEPPKTLTHAMAVLPASRTAAFVIPGSRHYERSPYIISVRHTRSSSFPRRGSHDAAGKHACLASSSSSSSSLSSSSSTELHGVHFTLQSTFGRPLRLYLQAWNNVKDIKDAIEREHGVPASRIRVFYGGREWSNARTLHDINVNDDDVVYAVLTRSRISTSRDVSLSLFGGFTEFVDRRVRVLVRQCRQGLLCGLSPQLTLEGSGGTYKLRSARKQVVGMFKPCDEEPFAPNNPRGHVGQLGHAGFRRGVRSGEAASREIAAYLLDHDEFAGVPFTTKVQLYHPGLHVESRMGMAAGGAKTTAKVGSLQAFVSHDELAGDLAPQCFPHSEVHKIAILDLRLLNVDRNDSNILVCRDPFRLVPIDHGYSLPRLLEVGWCDWVWLGWPQAHVPFDNETLAYIAKLDVDADIHLLRSRLGINETSLKNARISTMLLQMGAKAGLTLYEIGTLASRGELEAPSALEIAAAQAEALALKTPVLRRSMSDGVVPTALHSKAAVDEGCDCDRDSDTCACDCACDHTPTNLSLAVDEEAFWEYIQLLLHQLIERQRADGDGSHHMKKKSFGEPR